MSSTLSMWLGIAFVFLGVSAVLLQAWLWNPRYWDAVNKKTRAPRYGLLLHRWVGIVFTIIYIAMMFEMVPRLWEYQVELPARTVVHAVAAIVLGILLSTKLLILWFFRHFEESMPSLGYGILICTLLLGALSVPFALRAEGIGVAVFEPDNIERTKRLLGRLTFDQEVTAEQLVAEASLTRGRKVLVDECVRCHDMRTILAEPKTADGWFKVVDRMTEKPSVFGEPIRVEDVPYVTAYLIAITPEIHESRQLMAEQQRMQAAIAAQLNTPAAAAAVPVPGVAPAQPVAPAAPGQAVAPAPVAPAAPPADALVAAKVDTSKGPQLLEKLCVDCHELDEVTDFGGADQAGWAKVMRDMVDEGADIPEADAKILVAFLAEKYPKK